MSLDWGSVPDWIGALGTAGAFVIAASAWRIQQTERHEAAAEFRRAEADRRESRARERVAQARGLTIWTTSGGGHSLDTSTYRWTVRLNALNTSTAALTDIEVRVRVFRDDFDGAVTHVWHVLPPTPEGRPAVIDLDIDAPRPDPSNDVYPSLEVDWCATDAAGVRWHRTFAGELIEQVQATVTDV